MSEIRESLSEKDLSKRMWLYASPRLGIQVFIGIIDFALLFIYTQVYNLDPLLSGIAQWAGKIGIALAQFILGWVSDHTHTRWGRRKPYLFLMTPLLAISFFLLIVPGVVLGGTPDEMVLFWWFFTFNVLAQSLYGVTSVYHAWTAELFKVDQRPRVSSYQNIFNFLGTGIFLVFSFGLLSDVKIQLQNEPTTIPPVFLWSIVALGIFMVSMFYIACFVLPKENTPEYKTKLMDDLRAIVKNRNMVNVTLMQGISSFAWAMIGSVMLIYVEVVLKMTGVVKYAMGGLFILVIIGVLSIWRKKIKQWGKKKTVLSIFGLGIIFLPLSALGFFEFSASVVFGFVFISMLGVIMGGWYLFPYLMYADLSEDNEKITGELKAGIYTGFPSILLNIFQAFSLLFNGWLLSLPNIVNVPNTDPFSVGLILWGPVASLILIFALLFAKKYVQLDFAWEKKVTK